MKNNVKIPFRQVKYAIMAVTLLVTAVFVIRVNKDKESSTKQLRDGSDMVFHGNSSAKEVIINDSIREVMLNGKAYFEVKENKTAPFIIRTENARIETLGASFVIDTYHKKTEVYVESGLVSLIKTGRNGRELRVRLTKGEVGIVAPTRKGVMKRNNHDVNYLSWKTKTLLFNHAKMADVVTLIEDVYGINMVFDNPDLRHCRLTVKIHEVESKKAVERIGQALNLTYELKGNQVVWLGKGCGR